MIDNLTKALIRLTKEEKEEGFFDKRPTIPHSINIREIFQQPEIEGINTFLRGNRRYEEATRDLNVGYY